MEHFGTTRLTLSETFRHLESESLVQVNGGLVGGAGVDPPNRETLTRLAGLIFEYEGVTVGDVCDAQATLQAPMAEQLATDRDPSAIAELEEIVARESHPHPGSDSVDQLTDFHAAISRLSGNVSLQVVCDMLHHIVAKTNRSLQPEGDGAEQTYRHSVETHAMVLELIKAGEAEKARALWKRHLQNADEFGPTGAEKSTVVDLLE